MKLTVLFPLLLLASAQLEAAPDIDLKSRPAQILSIDRESGFAKFRIEAKSRSARARPREVELMISYKNEWSARVVRIIAPNRKRPGTLDDLKPGMSVLVTGLDAISIRIANEITIDERKTAQ